jgi:hypothetical protein
MDRETVTTARAGATFSAIYSTCGERWLETPDKYLQYLSIILFERFCGEGPSFVLSPG